MESKSCNVCSLEAGTTIFAMINCIIVSLASILSFAWVAHAILHYDETGIYIIYLCLGLVVMVLCLLAFTFSVLLAHGVLQRKPKLIHAYFIYGVIVNTICLSACAVLVASCEYSEVPLLSLCIILAVCVAYSAILWMIWETYKKVTKDNQFKHEILIEKY